MQGLLLPTSSAATSSRATPWHRQHSATGSGLLRSLRLASAPSTRTSTTTLAVLRDSASAAALHPSQTAQSPPADSLFAAAAVATPTTATGSYTHTAFAAFFVFLGLMTAAASSPDWYLDVAAFGGLWGLLWAGCARLQPSSNTVTLLCVLPVMHLLGALGLYSWELGNLSWDVLVHISNGCIATLLFAAVLADVSRASESGDGAADAGGGAGAAGAGRQQQRQRQPRWQERAVGVLKLVGLLLLSTSMVEVVEAAGGQLAGHAGEGMFLRGPGDMCTASLPCSEEVDTLKDMVDGCAGMALALLGLATRGASSNTTASIGAGTNSTGV